MHMSRGQIQATNITPEEFERQVKVWLQAHSRGLKKFHVTNLKKVPGHGGEFEIDAVAQFEVLGGAIITVLVECKYYNSNHPVERDLVIILGAKIRDTGAHKGIIFTTSKFQRGALTYAKAHGIATVRVENGRTHYETKSYGPVEIPPWVPTYDYIGWMVTLTDDGNEHHSLITDDRGDPLQEWMGISR